MTDRKQQLVEEAVQVWELGLLYFLYDKRIITEKEFIGIRGIAEEQFELSKSVS